MQDASTGWAVWPSGKAWVLLGTKDGWATVQNATPGAVPTGGGLVLADGQQPGSVAVAVRPYERLRSSPVLTRVADGPWTPAELPGAVADSAAAVAISGQQVTAVLSDGSVRQFSGPSWKTLLQQAQLPGRLTLTGIVWASSAVGWATGGRGDLGPTAFGTVDGGGHWAGVTASVGTAASAPCGGGRSWVLPVLAQDRKLFVLRTSDAGDTWVRGTSAAVGSAPPVWGCHAEAVWVTATVGSREHLLASNDSGQTWVDRGELPTGIDALAPTGDGRGFAVSRTGKETRLWIVTDDGATFRERPLPGWVSSLGADEGTS